MNIIFATEITLLKNPMMKKSISLFIAAMLFGITAFAQMADPVKWNSTGEILGDGEFMLYFDATIDDGWHVYSQDVAEGGPIPARFDFSEIAKDVQLIGKVKEMGKAKEGFDPIFEMDVKKYTDKVRFAAKIKLLKPEATFEVPLLYMACDAGRCTRLEEYFEFTLSYNKTTRPVDGNSGNTGSTTEKSTTTTTTKKVVEQPDKKTTNVTTAPPKDDKTITSGKNDKLAKKEALRKKLEERRRKKEQEAKAKENGKVPITPDEKNDKQTEINTKTDDNKTSENTNAIAPVAGVQNRGNDKNVAEWKPLIKDCGVDINAAEKKTRTLWKIFLLGFLGGFAALLTPCVFPMIPLTVSFFTKTSKDRASGIKNALIYAIFIIYIYVGLGFLVTVMFGPNILHWLSVNPWFNLAFFVIFVIFAISFFGYFEITLPNSLVNKVSAAEERGGLIGIFFMAFTLALVSFSCTGPIIGTLLVEAAVDGERMGPLTGMAGFALALALPFALFAAFPGWLNSLPKSGGWLNTVKVVLGFIELIFALKFLSNADLVPQLGLLKRETFLIIWIILLVGLAAYLMGFIRFPHDSPTQKLSVPRMGFAALAFAFAIYLIPGIMCKPLGLVSGFPPPIFYSYGCGGDHAGGLASEQHIQDLEEGIALAKKEGKPVMIDFTGWACVNCRKMEENVWTKAEIESLINQYTLVSLYVDEDVDLPETERFEYFLNDKKRKVKTVGDKWSYLQTTCFNANVQPWYVLLSPEGEYLNMPVGYTPNSDEYSKFLQEGLINYEQGKTLISASN